MEGARGRVSYHEQSDEHANDHIGFKLGPISLSIPSQPPQIIQTEMSVRVYSIGIPHRRSESGALAMGNQSQVADHDELTSRRHHHHH
jgi:hypothetical protein